MNPLNKVDSISITGEGAISDAAVCLPTAPMGAILADGALHPAGLIENGQSSRTRATRPARTQPGRSIAILGIPFDNVTTSEAMQQIERMVLSRQPHYLVTANVDFLVQSLEDVELRRILLDAHLVVCDGTPLVWASHLLGNPLPERVAGADLVPLLLKLAAEKKYRVFFLGATPDSVARAVARLQAEHPELTIAGYYSPPFSKLLDMDHARIRQLILDAKPDMLFVSLGCPKQEKWIAMHYRALGVPVAAGVGATIDFLAGQVKRAPIWMQRSGTEWIYRLAQEPRRLLRRYVKDLWVFGWAIGKQWWRFHLRRKQRSSAVFNYVFEDSTSAQFLRLPEHMDMAGLSQGRLPEDTALRPGMNCILECSRVRFIDSTGIGQLIKWHKLVRKGGGELVLLGPTPQLTRTLRLMRLDGFFSSANDLPAATQLLKTRLEERTMAVRLRTAAAVSPLIWQGEVTASNAESFWQLTEPHLTATPVDREFVIDLSAVRFIDSTGLGIMIRVKKAALRENKNLVFTGLQPAVRNVLRLSRLEEFLLGKPAARADSARLARG